jgi:hypothetical protein
MLQGNQTLAHVQSLLHVWCDVSPRPSVDGKAQENKTNQDYRPKSANGRPKEKNVESRQDKETIYEAP